MSDLISDKVKEARLLLKEADAEETEGTKLDDQIKALQARSSALLKSAREKRAIGQAQLEVVEKLSQASETTSLVVVAAAPEPVKKRGGRQKAAPAPTPAPTVAATKAKGAKGKKASKAAAAATAPVAVVPAAKPAKAKPAAKPKKAAAAAAAAAATTTAISKVVRVPAERNGLPPLRDRLQTVIAGDEVTIAEAITRLKAHDKAWVPKSDDLSAYISLVLSTHAKKGDVFERVKRGIYRVASNAPAIAVKPSSTPKKLAKTNGSNGHANGASNGIEDLGSNVLDNPFSGASAAAE